MDNIVQKKLSKVEGYNIYFYHSYKKNEWDNNISPISKKQNMLIIECKNGGYEESRYACIFSVNMKIDKNNIILRDFNKDSLPYIRYINKNEENTYLFKSYKDEYISFIPIYLNIETYSGNIEIECSLNNTPT